MSGELEDVEGVLVTDAILTASNGIQRNDAIM